VIYNAKQNHFVHVEVFQPPFSIEFCQQKPKKPSVHGVHPNDLVLVTTNSKKTKVETHAM